MIAGGSRGLGLGRVLVQNLPRPLRQVEKQESVGLWGGQRGCLEEETDDYDSRRSAARHLFEEDLEMRDTPRQTSLPASKRSRRPVNFDDGEKESSEYETEEEEERPPPCRKSIQEEEPEYEEEQERGRGEEEEAYEESEEGG
ncbi:hypothetical protein BC332_10442 [Capsicum chinense]|nr:hypothetical protein BC332_10442 [Capsicum chinense]